MTLQQLQLIDGGIDGAGTAVSFQYLEGVIFILWAFSVKDESKGLCPVSQKSRDVGECYG